MYDCVAGSMACPTHLKKSRLLSAVDGVELAVWPSLAESPCPSSMARLMKAEGDMGGVGCDWCGYCWSMCAEDIVGWCPAVDGTMSKAKAALDSMMHWISWIINSKVGLDNRASTRHARTSDCPLRHTTLNPLSPLSRTFENVGRALARARMPDPHRRPTSYRSSSAVASHVTAGRTAVQILSLGAMKRCPPASVDQSQVPLMKRQVSLV